jgi:hypothetical protein
MPVADILHQLFGTHVPDPDRNHWDQGHFASVCITCGKPMVRLPGLPWRLRGTR